MKANGPKWIMGIAIALIQFLSLSQGKAASVKIYCPDPETFSSHKNSDGSYTYTASATLNSTKIPLKAKPSKAQLNEIKFDIVSFGRVGQNPSITVECAYYSSHNESILLKGPAQLGNAKVASNCRHEGCKSNHNDNIRSCYIACD